MKLKWKIKNLGDIADIKRGLASQHLNYVENANQGVRLIRINDFKSNSPKFITNTEKTKKLTLRKSDILMAGTGATAGISYLVDDLWDGLPFSYNAPRIRVKNDNSSKFIYYVLNSEKIKNQQNKLFTGNELYNIIEEINVGLDTWDGGDFNKINQKKENKYKFGKLDKFISLRVFFIFKKLETENFLILEKKQGRRRRWY